MNGVQKVQVVGGGGLNSGNLGPAQGIGTNPNPAIGSSVNYVQGMQGEGRTQTFAQGANEGKGNGPSAPPGSTSILSKVKNIFTGGGEGEAGAGDAAAGDAAASAGAGIAEDAAMIAV